MAGLCLNINLSSVIQNSSGGGDVNSSADGTTASEAAGGTTNTFSGNWNYNGDGGKNLSKFDAEFKRAGKALNMDWRLVAAHSHMESRWNETVVNSINCGGLYQFMGKYWHGSAPKGYEDPKWRLVANTATSGYINCMTKKLNKFSNAKTRCDQIMLAFQEFHDGHVTGTVWGEHKGNKYSNTGEAKKYVRTILEHYKKFGGVVNGL